MLQKNEEVLNQVYQAVTVPIIKKDTIGHMKLSGCNVDCYVIDHQPTNRKMVIRVDVRNRSGIKDYHEFFFLDMDLQAGFKVAKLLELDVNEEAHTVTYRLAQEPSLELGAEFRSLVPGSINSLIEYIDVTIMDLDKDIFMSFPTNIRYIYQMIHAISYLPETLITILTSRRTITKNFMIELDSIECIMMIMIVIAIRIRTLSYLIASMNISHQLELLVLKFSGCLLNSPIKVIVS